MNIKLRKEMAEAIGLKVLERYGASETGWVHREERNIDLALLAAKQVKELEKLIERHKSLKGGFVALYDLRIWLKSQTNPDQWARNARQMATLMKATLATVPGHRVFRLESDQWLCYYVNYLEYVEKSYTRDGRVIPPHVNLYLVYEEFGDRKELSLTFWEDDCRKKTPTKLLAEQNVFPETAEMRKTYIEDRDRYTDLWPRLGLQLHLWGVGVDDVDGNDDDDSRSWYRSRKNLYPLGTPDEPGRGVVDIFQEKPQERRNDEKVWLRTSFWGKRSVVTKEDDDDDGYVEGEEDELPPDTPVVEVPVHPFLVVFDLKRHLRLRVHVRNVDLHVYDTALADKLVLPKELKDLVALLIEHREGSFKDIVQGKAGGAVVLLAGPPGTGKTLTAEVYAEADERALYSVQCSQLGIKPEDLEEELLKCFTRCRRWNAVMLLDEADVYVHTRGNSLQQNAIVGVFLRVLEYQSAVLFLTTNRPDDVDDAILSRCIARLSYKIPSKPDQKRIWEILADGSGVSLPDAEINKIVTSNPTLSGRDVKNLLKLGLLTAKGKPVTASIVEFVKQFKPTA